MKNSILRGTLILAIAGLVSRLLGFFYKVYLAGHMSPERLGLYQLILPVYGLCFTFYASGIQTAISKRVSELPSPASDCRLFPKRRRFLFTGMSLSLSLAMFASLAIFFLAKLIADLLLGEPQAFRSLRIISLMFPFCAVTSCINGYCYGRKRASLPAGTQLLEQVVRILFVLFASTLFPSLYPDASSTVSCELACLGIVVGEIVASIFSLLLLFLSSSRKTCAKKPSSSRPRSLVTSEASVGKCSTLLLSIAVPLTANHLVLSLLHSYETILVPSLLRRGGLSPSASLSVLGVLNGMVLPFLYFPTAITSALSILLLPTISEAQASNQRELLVVTIRTALRYTLSLGFLFSGLFLTFGSSLCTLLFRNEEAGIYLTLAAFIAPLIYSITTTSSILNGLGRTSTTFRNSVIGATTQLLLLVFFLPSFGIYGYFPAVILSYLLQFLLDLYSIHKTGYLRFDRTRSLTRPLLALLLCSALFTPLLPLLEDRTIVVCLLLMAFSFSYTSLFLLFSGLFASFNKKKLSSLEYRKESLD